MQKTRSRTCGRRRFFADGGGYFQRRSDSSLASDSQKSRADDFRYGGIPTVGRLNRNNNRAIIRRECGDDEGRSSTSPPLMSGGSSATIRLANGAVIPTPKPLIQRNFFDAPPGGGTAARTSSSSRFSSSSSPMMKKNLRGANLNRNKSPTGGPPATGRYAGGGAGGGRGGGGRPGTKGSGGAGGGGGAAAAAAAKAAEQTQKVRPRGLIKQQINAVGKQNTALYKRDPRHMPTSVMEFYDGGPPSQYVTPNGIRVVNRRGDAEFIYNKDNLATADLHLSPQVEASLKPQPGEKFNLVPLTAEEEAALHKNPEAYARQHNVVELSVAQDEDRLRRVRMMKNNNQSERAEHMDEEEEDYVGDEEYWDEWEEEEEEPWEEEEEEEEEGGGGGDDYLTEWDPNANLTLYNEFTQTDEGLVDDGVCSKDRYGRSKDGSRYKYGDSQYPMDFCKDRHIATYMEAISGTVDACNDLPPYPSVPGRTISYTGCFGGFPPQTCVPTSDRKSRSLRQTIVDRFAGAGDLTEERREEKRSEAEWADEGGWGGGEQPIMAPDEADELGEEEDEEWDDEEEEDYGDYGDDDYGEGDDYDGDYEDEYYETNYYEDEDNENQASSRRVDGRRSPKANGMMMRKGLKMGAMPMRGGKVGGKGRKVRSESPNNEGRPKPRRTPRANNNNNNGNENNNHHDGDENNNDNHEGDDSIVARDSRHLRDDDKIIESDYRGQLRRGLIAATRIGFDPRHDSTRSARLSREREKRERRRRRQHPPPPPFPRLLHRRRRRESPNGCHFRVPNCFLDARPNNPDNDASSKYRGRDDGDGDGDENGVDRVVRPRIEEADDDDVKISGVASASSPRVSSLGTTKPEVEGGRRFAISTGRSSELAPAAASERVAAKSSKAFLAAAVKAFGELCVEDDREQEEEEEEEKEEEKEGSRKRRGKSRANHDEGGSCHVSRDDDHDDVDVVRGSNVGQSLSENPSPSYEGLPRRNCGYDAVIAELKRRFDSRKRLTNAASNGRCHHHHRHRHPPSPSLLVRDLVAPAPPTSLPPPPTPPPLSPRRFSSFSSARPASPSSLAPWHDSSHSAWGGRSRCGREVVYRNDEEEEEEDIDDEVDRCPALEAASVTRLVPEGSIEYPISSSSRRNTFRNVGKAKSEDREQSPS